MFTAAELVIIQKALAVQRASFVRLANRAGQPEAVIKSYQDSVLTLDGVAAKVLAETNKLSPKKA